MYYNNLVAFDSGTVKYDKCCMKHFHCDTISYQTYKMFGNLVPTYLASKCNDYQLQNSFSQLLTLSYSDI